MESVYLVEFYSGALLKAWPIPNSFIEHVATWQFQQQNEAITVTFTLSNGLKFIHPLLSTGDFVVPHPCNFDWDYSEDFKAYWRDEVHTIRCSSIEDVPKCFGELFGYPPTLFKYNHTEERIEKKNVSIGFEWCANCIFLFFPFLLRIRLFRNPLTYFASTPTISIYPTTITTKSR